MKNNILTDQKNINIGSVKWIPGIEEYGSILKTKTITIVSGKKRKKAKFYQINFNNSLKTLEDIESVLWYDDFYRRVVFALTDKDKDEALFLTDDLMIAVEHSREFNRAIRIIISIVDKSDVKFNEKHHEEFRRNTELLAIYQSRDKGIGDKEVDFILYRQKELMDLMSTSFKL